ncbi:sensor histidine kinase [Janibacter sp. G1551]|uniref:sensor histidine kinase n=1 Tax=Janibacter sp. G1551 TaxID=3420440 RepID=UPI003D07E6BC
MPTLNEVLRSSEALSAADTDWIHLLVEDWQVLSDLSFGDLILWVHTDRVWTAAAHVRPTTGPMVFVEDLVGTICDAERSAWIDEAERAGATVPAPHSQRMGDMLTREEAVPVVRAGAVVAVLTRHINLSRVADPSELERTYTALADAMSRMIAAGEWPSPSAPTGLRRGSPRVGDGVIHLDAEGIVLYVSPNAHSALRRLGHDGPVVGAVLAQIITDQLQEGDQVDESLALVTLGRAAWRAEAATDRATMTLKAIPLTERRRRVGAFVLVRDVTELRRRESEMISKDATIREIHHRVKNNLQTVAALLRLQARRVDDGAGRTALLDAVRRVSTIALVHETLSSGFDETVSFDDVAVRGLRAVVELATSEHTIESAVHGTFGRMRAEDATSVAMIISELVQNAAEHGLAAHGGRIVVTAERGNEGGEDILRVSIEDDGEGLPQGFRIRRAGLGTRIVTSLVHDLRGTIRWDDVEPRGTRVRFSARLRPLSRSADVAR